MVIREPFITVSVANCEGRRKKRGGYEKRGKGEVKGKARREGGHEKRGKARREGKREKRDWEGAREKEEQKMWSEQRIAVRLISPTHPNVLCGVLYPWRSHGHPLVRTEAAQPHRASYFPSPTFSRNPSEVSTTLKTNDEVDN